MRHNNPAHSTRTACNIGMVPIGQLIPDAGTIRLCGLFSKGNKKMNVVIEIDVLVPGLAGKFACMQKKCDMPTVFVGMHLWSETCGVGFPITAVYFHPRTGVMVAKVKDECISEKELSESVQGWLDDRFIIKEISR